MVVKEKKRANPCDVAMEEPSVKNLAGGRAFDDEVDSLDANVCERKRLLEDATKMLGWSSS